ncbi:hypothetical protein SCLCIDRAFT_30260 [Scleroderma citrinum Foug A]|uniref:Uncharacterized protein n=1 Tax=Scleroderma citrinum Foug A TaxID=1036808 RepID=A0A0C2ZSJ1_9AGAM|nr:hypothetical protein SCLCIDRAFT_30260 [Scleroderma citrinum Foug A]
MRHDALNLADPILNQPEEHHVISRSQNFLEDLARFMQTNIGDLAVNHFILKLKAHILPRIAAVHQDVGPQAVTPDSTGISALFCLGSWSLHGFVKDKDIKNVVV